MQIYNYQLEAKRYIEFIDSGKQKKCKVGIQQVRFIVGISHPAIKVTEFSIFKSTWKENLCVYVVLVIHQQSFGLSPSIV